MPDEMLRGTGPQVLGELLRLGSRSCPLCDDRELAEALPRQLDTPTEFEPVDEGSGPITASISQVLFGPCTQAGLLAQIRQFAKAHRTHPYSPMPVEVATVIYLASAAAGLRSSRQISELDDESLAESLDWAIHQAWVPPSLRDLLRDAAARLGRSEGLGGPAS